MAKIRAFIAVTLPQPLRHSLFTAGQRLAEQLPGQMVRWVQPERMHLTVRFLGDTAVAQLPAIQAALDQVGQQQRRFELVLGALGSFPRRGQPRVLWVGVEQQEPLVALARAVGEALEPLGWEREERPFRAHLTLGRIKKRARPKADWSALPWGEKVTTGSWLVSELHLIESELRPQGPLYTTRHISTLS